jgi:glutathione S-transferase
MYILHSIPDWASLCVHITLTEMGVPFALRLHDYDAGTLNTPAFRAISPFGLIPALETPDGPMFETGAILLWLSERHGLAPAPLSRDRAAFLKWFVFVNTSVHNTAVLILHPERPAGEDAAHLVASTAHKQMQAHLAAIEAMIVADKPVWLSGAQPSVLGHYLGMLVRWTVAFPTYPEHTIQLDDTPALKAVLSALETRPAAQKVALAEGLGPTIYTNPAS